MIKALSKKTQYSTWDFRPSGFELIAIKSEDEPQISHSLSYSMFSGGVTVNNAKVIEADAAATNGVIHVIDSVLLPPS